MSRRSGRANRCSKCQVTKEFCFCELIGQVSGTTRIKIMMHFRERWLTSNTAHMLEMIYPEVEIYTRGKLDDPNWQEVLFDVPGTPLFLFPEEDAIALSKESLAQFDRPYLIVPDGTWDQAKKMKRRIPALNAVQSVFIPANNESRYFLRRQKTSVGLSTYEAISFALEYFEGPQTKEALLQNFEIMVNAHLKARSRGFNLG